MRNTRPRSALPLALALSILLALPACVNFQGSTAIPGASAMPRSEVAILLQDGLIWRVDETVVDIQVAQILVPAGTHQLFLAQAIPNSGSFDRTTIFFEAEAGRTYALARGEDAGFLDRSIMYLEVVDVTDDPERHAETIAPPAE